MPKSNIPIDKNYIPDLELAYVCAYMLFPRPEDEEHRDLYISTHVINENLNPYKYNSSNAVVPKEALYKLINNKFRTDKLVNNSNCEQGVSVGLIFLSLLRIHTSGISPCISGARALTIENLKNATNSKGRGVHSLSLETLQAATRRYKKSAHLWASLVLLSDEEDAAVKERDYEKALEIKNNYPKLLTSTAETLMILYEEIPQDEKYPLSFNEDFWQSPFVDENLIGAFLPEPLSPEEAETVHEARNKNPKNKKTQ